MKYSEIIINGNTFKKKDLVKMIKAFNNSTISATKRCTIGFPATGIKGFGTVKLWGLRREPRPAIGTIIFIVLPAKAGIFLINIYL